MPCGPSRAKPSRKSSKSQALPGSSRARESANRPHRQINLTWTAGRRACYPHYSAHYTALKAGRCSSLGTRNSQISRRKMARKGSVTEGALKGQGHGPEITARQCQRFLGRSSNIASSGWKSTTTIGLDHRARLDRESAGSVLRHEAT